MDILKIKKPKSLSQKFVFYPNIKKDIQKNIKDLKLKPLTKNDSFEKSWKITIEKPKHTLIYNCFYKNQPALYKVLVLKQTASEWGFKRNIEITKTLARILPNYETDVLDFKFKTNFPKYVIFKFFPGIIYPIEKYSDKDIKDVIKNLLYWKDVKISQLSEIIKESEIIGPDAKLHKQNYQLDLSWMNFYLQELNNLFPNKKKILNFLRNNSEFVDKRRKNLCHGDFTPVNILIDKKANEVLFIDFEYTRLDHYAWDVANFYFITWEDPEKQALFLKKYLDKIKDKDEFWKLFAYQTIFDMTMLAYYSLVEISNRLQKVKNDNEKKEVIKKWQKCFWHCETRLDQALNNPKELLKPIKNVKFKNSKFDNELVLKTIKGG